MRNGFVMSIDVKEIRCNNIVQMVQPRNSCSVILFVNVGDEVIRLRLPVLQVTMINAVRFKKMLFSCLDLVCARK